MICKFCGNEIDDGSDFCFICGQKVEPAQQAAPAAESVDNVYSQPQQAAAPVTDTYQAQPAAPAYAQPAAAPVYAQPAQAPAQPVAPAAPVEAADGKKKNKKVKDPSVAGKGAKFFSFLFIIVGLILYRKAKKAGYEQKAVSILNAMMTGLCVKLAIANVILAKKYLFGAE